MYMNVSGKLRTEMDNFGKALQSVAQNFSNPDELINFTLDLVVKLGFSWGEGKLYQKTALQNLLFPVGIHYDRRKDDFRTDWLTNIFRKIHTCPADYEKNKGGKLDWNSNYSASVVPTGIEPVSRL